MIKYLEQALRRLFRKGEHTTTRIISLTAGLAFGILLLSEVLYYYSFDSFYPDASRIYVVKENYRPDKSSKEIQSAPYVSGGVAPGMKAEVPGIEAATRLNNIGSSVFYTNDKKSYKAQFSLADEHLFEVIPRPVINGDPEEILKNPMQCMVSDKIAAEMGGNVIGKRIELKEYPGKKLTIEGLFKALPENTNYHYDVLISMVSTSQFTWDGTQNWMGNDRYYTVVKLVPGIVPKSLAPAVRKMQEKHQDIQELEKQQQGMILRYTFEPVTKLYLDNVKDMVLILSAIAFAVLFVSLMNYTLLTLSALIKRAKSSAIHKTCGAQARNIQQLIFSETFILFFISLAGALLLIWLLHPLAEEQAGHKLVSELTPVVLWPLLLLSVLLVFLTSYLPGRFYSRVPVATAFRTYQQKRNKWNLALLSFQFAGASFILAMLVIVSLQYNKVITANHGYNPQGVYYGSTSGMDAGKISTVMNELLTLPGVKTVGTGSGLPTQWQSGNNVIAPDGEKELFNIADFYQIDENYLSILNIPVVEGNPFSQKNSATNDLLISKKCADKLRLFNGWKSVVGHQLKITEHKTSTIRGVFADFVIHSITDPDRRPSVFYYYPDEKFQAEKKQHPSYSFYILIKTESTAQNNILPQITDLFNRFLPHSDAVVKSLEQQQRLGYQTTQGFRNSMLTGNIIILLITVIGLLGYTSNEAARRRKELAIRRINGATLPDILRIFIFDLEYVAFPAVMVGLVCAWFTAGRWMQNFESKIPLHWEIFVACSLFILLLVTFIAAINYTRAATQNPVKALRYE